MDKYLLRYHDDFLKDPRSSFILMRAYLQRPTLSGTQLELLSTLASNALKGTYPLTGNDLSLSLIYSLRKVVRGREQGMKNPHVLEEFKWVRAVMNRVIAC